MTRASRHLVFSRTHLLITASLLPFAVLLFFVVRYSTFWPTGDDEGVLRFFLLFDSSGFNEKVRLIFVQHNEHRIVLTRLLGLLDYKATGTIHLLSWILLGNVSLLLIYYVFFKVCRQLDLALLVPVSFILFAAVSYENNFGAMMNSNFFVCAFSVFTLYLVVSEKPWPALLLSSLLMTLSNGGGLITLLLCAVIFLSKKQTKHFLIWTAWSALLIFLYFHHFQSPTFHPDPLKTILHHPWKMVYFFFVLNGSVASILLYKYSALKFVFGFSLFLFFVFLTLKKWYRRNLLLYVLFAYPLIVNALTSLTRSEFGLVAIASKYLVYPMLLLMVGTIALYEVTQPRLLAKPGMQRIFLAAVFVLSLGYFSGSLFLIHRFRQADQWQKASMELGEYNYLTGKTTHLNQLIKNGSFRIPSDYVFLHSKSYYDSLDVASTNTIPGQPAHTIHLDSLYCTERDLHISGSLTPKGDVWSTLIQFYPLMGNENESVYNPDGKGLFRLYLLDDTTTTNRFHCVIKKNKFILNTSYQVIFSCEGTVLLRDTVLIQP